MPGILVLKTVEKLLLFPLFTTHVFILTVCFINLQIIAFIEKFVFYSRWLVNLTQSSLARETGNTREH